MYRSLLLFPWPRLWLAASLSRHRYPESCALAMLRPYSDSRRGASGSRVR